MEDDVTTKALREKYGTPVHPRIKPSLLRDVDDIRRSERRSRNQMVEILLEEAVENRKRGA